MKEIPIVGMIVPPAGTQVPPEPPAMYPSEVEFIAEGLGLDRLTPDGYDAVIDKVAEVSRRLAARGADAISLMGTSLSFYKGVEFNGELVETMERATGLPAMTMSDAIVAALKAVGARNIALATAYVETVSERLRHFLDVSGFTVSGTESLNIDSVEGILEVGDGDLMRLGERAMARSPGADALLISCGGLQTLRVTRRLEALFPQPVVTSATAGAWAAVRMVGHGGNAPGFGRLAELDATATNHTEDLR